MSVAPIFHRHPTAAIAATAVLAATALLTAGCTSGAAPAAHPARTSHTASTATPAPTPHTGVPAGADVRSITVTGKRGKPPVETFTHPIRGEEIEARVITAGHGKLVTPTAAVTIREVMYDGSTEEPIASAGYGNAKPVVFSGGSLSAAQAQPDAVVIPDVALAPTVVRDAVVGRRAGSRILITGQAGRLLDHHVPEALQLKSPTPIAVVVDIVDTSARARGSHLPAWVPPIRYSWTGGLTVDGKKLDAPDRLETTVIVPGTGAVVQKTGATTVATYAVDARTGRRVPVFGLGTPELEFFEPPYAPPALAKAVVGQRVGAVVAVTVPIVDAGPEVRAIVGADGVVPSDSVVAVSQITAYSAH